MSGARTTRTWALGRGGWAVGLVLGLAVGGVGSCLGPNRGHCLYRGGDLACDTGICVFAPAGGAAEGVGDDGCFADGRVPEGFFHARYGLPARREATEGDPMDVASVQGLLRRLTDGERSVTEEELERFFGPADDPDRADAGAIALRMDLAKEGVVKAKYDVAVDRPQCDAAEVGMAPICPYYAAIEAWLADQPPGTGTSTDTGSTETLTGDATETTSGDTTEPECTVSSECTEAVRPVCDRALGMCVGCDAVALPDQACAEADAERPLCVEGRCVQCTDEDVQVCAAQGLVCDGESGDCVQCTEHAQCEVGACAKAEGTCFAADAQVLHVDGDGGRDHPSVGAAVSAIPNGGVGVIVVHAIDDGSPYTGAPLINGGKTIAVLAAAGEQPTLQGVANPGLRVEGAGTVVYVEGLRLSQSSGLGLRVTGATAWVDRSRIVQNSGGGILAQSGATLTLRNSFVGGNVPDIDVITLDASSLDMLSTTVGGGAVAEERARVLFCQGTATADVRNSILVSFDPMPAVECPGAALVTSATEAEVGNLTSMWFAGYASGDFHLTAAGGDVFGGVGQWQLGDPTTDIDGDARPTTDGAADYAGADVP
jgi:hypothetical protein